MAYKKNFEPKAKKMTYGEVWSMAVDSKGESIFTVRDNDCVVSDLSKTLPQFTSICWKKICHGDYLRMEVSNS